VSSARKATQEVNIVELDAVKDVKPSQHAGIL
jgi:hypothetical protein